MDYITRRRGQTLSNDPYEITYDDIKMMRRENLKDKDECRRVTQSRSREESYYADNSKLREGKIENARWALYEEMKRDEKTSGFTISYPHGTVIRQGERNSYYRGENQIYPKSQSSLYRQLDKQGSEQDKQLYRLVSDMRIEEFCILLRHLEIVKFWEENYGTVLYEPLAQHYGLETKWLDITGDFDTALFFATCYWDKEKGWRPLSSKQTESCETKKYGAIFHMPQWHAIHRLMTAEFVKEESPLKNRILPIGFQPFMRCHSQYAYGICMDRPFPLQNDIGFEKLYFRHSEKLSNEVYERMDFGRKIYPQEGLNDFQDIIKAIQNATSFSEEAFQNAMVKNPCLFDIQECRAKIENSGIFGNSIKITDGGHPAKVHRQRIRKMNRKYAGFSIEKEYGIQLSTRLFSL